MSFDQINVFFLYFLLFQVKIKHQNSVTIRNDSLLNQHSMWFSFLYSTSASEPPPPSVIVLQGESGLAGAEPEYFITTSCFINFWQIAVRSPARAPGQGTERGHVQEHVCAVCIHTRGTVFRTHFLPRSHFCTLIATIELTISFAHTHFPFPTYCIHLINEFQRVYQAC